jgi:hypothetical protein
VVNGRVESVVWRLLRLPPDSQAALCGLLEHFYPIEVQIGLAVLRENYRLLGIEPDSVFERDRDRSSSLWCPGGRRSAF